MKRSHRTLFIAALVAATMSLAVVPAARASHNDPKPAETPKRYPLRGVIVDVRPDRSSIIVKHEDIPGLMPAMTMPFKVEAEILKTVKNGQAIVATLVDRDGDYWLEDVKLAPKS